MKKSYIAFSLIGMIVPMLVMISCQSGQTSKPDLSDSIKAKAAQNLVPADFKFSMFISGSGAKDGNIDSWTVDTNGMMAVHASHRISSGKNQELRALAGLDPPDLDTLRTLMWNGKLQTLDPADLTQQCVGDEHFLVKIVPLSTDMPVMLSFDACAAEFNMLTGEQRRYFTKFMAWWGRMRVKYRPIQPE